MTIQSLCKHILDGGELYLAPVSEHYPALLIDRAPVPYRFQVSKHGQLRVRSTSVLSFGPAPVDWGHFHFFTVFDHPTCPLPIIFDTMAMVNPKPIVKGGYVAFQAEQFGLVTDLRKLGLATGMREGRSRFQIDS